MDEPGNHLQRFQELLRELFQLDLADLDFGLYRLLNLKRDEIEKFLTEQLPHQVEEAFSSVGAADHAWLRRELDKLAAQIRQDVADDAIFDNGQPNPDFANVKLLKEYAVRRRQVIDAEATEARKAEVFNHLYNFFSRYYEEGDFIARRRYGARETYAVPYDGQEVFFHWVWMRLRSRNRFVLPVGLPDLGRIVPLQVLEEAG